MANRVLLLVICVGLLSGCLSASSKGMPTSELGIPASRPGSATLSGRVLNFAGLGLPSADIQVEPGTLHAVTDATGSFEFKDVPAGDYGITAERLGYELGTLQVHLASDTVNRATLTLRPIEVAAGFQAKSSRFDGIIQCSANAYYPSNLCGRPLGASQDHVRVETERATHIGGLQFELVWTPTTPLTGQQLEIDVCLPRTDEGAMNCRDLTQDAFQRSASGESAVVLRIPAEDLPEGETVFDAWVGAGHLSPYPTIGQTFTLYSTVCYKAMCPEDYSAAD